MFPNDDEPLMAARSGYRLAVCLALLGQFVVTFGLPMPALANPGGVDSVCGCSPSDRANGRCCCSPRKVDFDALRAQESPASPPSCCAKRPADSTKKADIPTTTVRWYGGIMAERCHGPADRAVLLVAPLSYVPPAPASWRFDWVLAGMLELNGAVLIVTAAVPDLPPPR